MPAALTRPLHTSSAPSAVLAQLINDAFEGLDGDLDRVRASLSRAVALVGGSQASGAGLSRGGLAGWQARKIAVAIEDNLETGIAVAQLAASVRFSRSHFTRAFKEHFGCCPQQYIVEQRVQRALRLLLVRERRLCDVALACGFSDQAHLSRMFRRATGVTPNTWRRAGLAA